MGDSNMAIMRWLRRKPLTRRERIHRLINARGIGLSSAQVPSPHNRERAKASYRRATNGSSQT